jgi:hypothetical protein
MRKSLLLKLAPCLVIPPLLAACGSGPASGPDPKTVVATYYSALFQHYYDQAIKYLSVTTAPNPSMNVTTAGELMAQDQEYAASGTSRSCHVNSQSISGATASVNVTISSSGSPESTTVQLSQNNGTWVITFGDNPRLLY